LNLLQLLQELFGGFTGGWHPFSTPQGGATPQVTSHTTTTFGSVNSPQQTAGSGGTNFVGGPSSGSNTLGAGALGGAGTGGGTSFDFTTAMSGGSAFTLQDFVGSAGGPAAGLSPMDVLQGANVTGSAGTVDTLHIQAPGFKPFGGHG